MTAAVAVYGEDRWSVEAGKKRAAAAMVDRLRGDFPRWATKCFYILDKEQKLRPLILNSVQRRIEAAEQEELRKKGRARIYVLKGRQGGVTTHQQAKNVHAIWSRRGANVLTLAHDRDTTDKIFKITLHAIDNFPESLLPRMGPRETREISFVSRDSTLWTGTAGAGKRTGRSVTLVRLHGSEFAFWDEPKKTLNTVAPALERDGTTMLLETTGSGFDSDGHNFWREAQTGANSYRALFFPWWECDAVHYRTPLLARDELGKLEDDEKDLVKRYGLELDQIKWRRQKIKDMARDEFLQEYAEDEESCWLSVGGMFYDAAVLKHLMSRSPQPAESLLEGSLELYAEPSEGERVIIGADTAEGGSDNDRSAWTARGMKEWGLKATYASTTVEPREFASILNTWGRLFGMALLVVEKNAHGITVLRHLRDDHKYPLDRIYHRIAHDKGTTEQSERIGWHTGEESKPLLLDAGRDLLNAAKDGHAGVPSRPALRDALAVRRDKNGRVKLNGRDMLTSELLAWMGRSYPIAAPPAFWSI